MTPLQAAALQRLDVIRKSAEQVLRMAERCRSLVEAGLVAPTEGVPAHAAVAQYSELIAMSGNTISVVADTVTKSMRDLSCPPTNSN